MSGRVGHTGQVGQVSPCPSDQADPPCRPNLPYPAHSPGA